MKCQIDKLFVAVICSSISLFSVSHLLVEGKIYDKCKLAQELVQRHSFGRTFISNWICLIEAESRFNTSKILPYPPVYESFGLFQINNKKWCRKGYIGGVCKSRCEDFVVDDIRRAAACANLIFTLDGFKAWKGWMNRCKGKPLPPLLHECGLPLTG